MLDPGDIQRAAFLWPNAVAVTPSDATQYGTPAGTQLEKDKGPLLGLYVGTAGDVKVDFAGGATAITYKNVPAGTFLPGLFTRVYASGTSASNILGGRT